MRPLRPLPRRRGASTAPLALQAGRVGLAGALLVALAAPAAGQTRALSDPTRPPPALAGSGAPTETAALRPRGHRPPAVAVPAADAAAETPQLQGLHLPASGPAMALIDGRLVKTGDTVGAHRVVAIDALGVALASRTGTERIELLAGSPKQPAGSITITRSARFVPAVPAAADGDIAPASAERRGVGPSTPTKPGPLSVAGRTSP